MILPVLKWAGGKRQLLPQILQMIPDDYDTYCEPFLGGGAILFNLCPEKAIVNDVNAELANVYTVIRDNPNELIAFLATYDNNEETFYTLRNIDRNKEDFGKLSMTERAARILYLNKTCFNGLYRVNKSGEFNVPFGKYKKPNIINEAGLRAMHEYLSSTDIFITSGDFQQVLEALPHNAFVYLNPPYDTNFTGYSQGGFPQREQARLKECCDDLNERGIRFLLSNSDTEFIRDLYSKYDITSVQAKRAINSKGTGRGCVGEVLVKNYRKRS